MTVKELIAFFEECAQLDENVMNFQIVNVGYNCYGEWDPALLTKDATVNYEDGVIRLWDWK